MTRDDNAYNELQNKFQDLHFPWLCNDAKTYQRFYDTAIKLTDEDWQTSKGVDLARRLCGLMEQLLPDLVLSYLITSSLAYNATKDDLLHYVMMLSAIRKMPSRDCFFDAFFMYNDYRKKFGKYYEGEPKPYLQQEQP